MMHSLIIENFNKHAIEVVANTHGMEVLRLPTISYANSTLSCDTFNIIQITDGPHLYLEELKQSISHFRNKQLDFCLWVDEHNLTQPIKGYLEQNGLTCQGKEIGMALTLSNYQKQVIISKHETSIRQVKDAKSLKDYASVIAHNWSPPDQHIYKFYELTASQYLASGLNISLFVYYENEIPVGTIEVFPTDTETVGLYGLATLTAYRKKGIGKALTTYALNFAKETQYKHAVLQATEDGLGIYQRLGFKNESVFYEYA